MADLSSTAPDTGLDTLSASVGRAADQFTDNTEVVNSLKRAAASFHVEAASRSVSGVSMRQAEQDNEEKKYQLDALQAVSPSALDEFATLQYQQSVELGEVEKLTQMGKLFSSAGSAWDKGVLTVEKSLLDSAEHFGYGTTETAKQKKEIEQQLTSLETDRRTGGGRFGLSGLSLIPHSTFQQLPNMTYWMYGIAKGLAKGPTGEFSEDPGETFAGLMGANPIGVIFSGVMSEARDELRAQGLDPNEHFWAPTIAATAMTGLEFVGAYAQVGGLLRIGRATAGSFAKKALRNRTFGEAFRLGVGGLAREFGGEVGTEVTQGAIAKFTAGLVAGIENDHDNPIESGFMAATSDAALEEYGETAVETARAVAGLMLPGSVLASYKGYREVAQANRNQEILEEIIKIGGNLSLNDGFIERTAADNGVRSIGVKAKAFDAALSEAGVNPDQAARQMGISRAELEAARDRDGFVDVSTGKFVHFIGRNGLVDPLILDLRLNNEGMTAREAQEAQKEFDEETKASLNQEEQVKGVQEGLKAVEDLSPVEQVKELKKLSVKYRHAPQSAIQSISEATNKIAKTLAEGEGNAAIKRFIAALPTTVKKSAAKSLIEDGDIDALVAKYNLQENEAIKALVDRVKEVESQVESVREVQRSLPTASTPVSAQARQAAGFAAAEESSSSAGSIAVTDKESPSARTELYKKTLKRLREIGVHDQASQDVARVWSTLMGSFVREYAPEVTAEDLLKRNPRSFLSRDLRNEDGKGPSGKFIISNGQIIIDTALQGKEEAGRTLVHEIFHAMFFMLMDLAETNQQAREDLNALLDQAKTELEAEGRWPSDKKEQVTATAERISIWSELYIEEGRAPSADLEPAFNRFKRIARQIYASLKDMIRELNGRVADRGGVVRGDALKIFDNWFSDDATRSAQKAMSAEDVSTGGPSVFFDEETLALFDAGDVQGVADRLVAQGVPEKSALKHAKDLVENRKEAQEKVADKVRNTLTKKIQSEWNDAFRLNKEQALAMLHEHDPSSVALARLQRNQLTVGVPLEDTEVENANPIKLSYDDAVRVLGQEEVDRLNGLGPRIAQKSSSSAEILSVAEAAARMGFSSDTELVDALRGAESVDVKASDIAVNMTELELGPKDQSAAIEEVVQESLKTDKKLAVMRTELRLLHEKRFPTARETAKRVYAPVRSNGQLAAQAAHYVSLMNAETLNPKALAREMDRHGRDAAKLYWKGDLQAAAEAKVKQITAYHYYRAALGAKEMIDKVNRLGKQLSKMPAQKRVGLAGLGLLEEMNKIITELGIGKPVIPVQSKESTAAFISRMRDEHGAPLPDANSLAARNPEQPISVQQMSEAHNLLRAISKIGTVESEAVREERKESVEQSVNIILNQLGKHRGGKLERNPFGRDKATTQAVDKIHKFFSSQIKMEHLFHFLDFEAANGPLHSMFFQNLVDAGQRESIMHRQHNERMEKTMEKLGYSKQDRVDMAKPNINVPELGLTMSKWDLIMLFLNLGNNGNRQALLEGYTQWSESDIVAAVDRLDKRDMDFAQSIIDELESFRGPAFKIHREITGVEPIAVEARPIVTRHGTYRGGYFPISVDFQAEPRLVLGKNVGPGQDIDGAFGHMSSILMTSHGHTKARQGTGGRPIKLNPMVINRHVNQVIHDITHRAEIMELWKVLSHAEVAKAMSDTVGTEMYRQIGQWLVDIAGSSRNASMDSVAGAFGKLRTNMTATVLGANLGTMLSQSTGAVLSIHEIGAKYFAKGLAESIHKNPLKAYRWAKENSLFMAQRMERGYERDTRELYEANKEMFNKIPGMTANARASFLKAIGMAQMLVDLPTFIGAYHKAMDGQVEGVEAGDQGASVAYSEGVVRRTQSGADTIDLSEIQRQRGWASWFTMFYSFFSMQFNKLYFSGKRISRDGSSAIPGAVAEVGALFMVAALEDLVRGRYDLEGGDEEDWEQRRNQFFGTMTTYPFEGIIGVRDIVGLIKQDSIYGRTFGGSPYDGMVKSVASVFTAARDLGVYTLSGDESDLPSESDVKKAIRGISIGGGIPGAVQAIKLYEGILSQVSGDNDDKNVMIQAYRTLVNKRAFGGD